MARSRKSAKSAGTATERAVANYLAQALDDDRIDRRPRNGKKDRGDIGGVQVRGQRLVIEAKDCARSDFPGWVREAHIEAAHDNALCGVVVAKRRGTTDPSRYWCVMELKDLVALITGEPQEGRYE